MSNFNNGQNNNKDRNNMNTNSIQFMNKDGFQPSTLVLGFWNEMLSVKIHPALPKEQQTETRVYNYDQNVSTAINVEKLGLLLDRIESELVPAMEDAANKSIGIQVGGNSLLVISTGVAKFNEVRPYIAIHKDLDQDTKKPQVSIYYEFKSQVSIDDYDPETGKYTLSKPSFSEFKVFINSVKEAIKALTNAQAHSTRNVNKYFNEKQTGMFREMASKLGVETQYTGGNRRSYNNNNNFFDQNNNTNQNTNNEFTSSSTDNIDDLEKWME